MDNPFIVDVNKEGNKGEMPDIFDVIIIGGGLAGLTSAIHLSKHNIKVLLVEKTNYPSHKVCGEYISKEERTPSCSAGSLRLLSHRSSRVMIASKGERVPPRILLA